MIDPGTLLQNRYRVAEQIGKGGMGEVYVAKDERFQSAVAIKRNFLDDPEMSKAFRREARLLNHLRHGALPKVSDHFSEGGGHFLVMEYIEGSDLAELMKQRKVPFPLTDVMRWADELLDALDYLHTQEPPVVHRDIKPPNIKLTPRGKIVLLDFGLAKGAPSQTTPGTSSSVYGYSLNFAPLEQMEGSGTGPRSDLYSLAATLYFLLTGVRPPDAVARAVAAIKGQPDPLRPAHMVQAQVPAAVGQILHRAMSQNSALRHATAAELRGALRLAANDIARREAGMPVKAANILPQSLPSSKAAAAEEATVRTNLPGRHAAQESVESHDLSQNHYSASQHEGESDALVDSRRRPRLYDSETVTTHAAARREGAQTNRPRVIFACLLVICAAVGAYLLARPSSSSAPTAGYSTEVQNSAPSSQQVAPIQQAAGGAVYSDSSQATQGQNAPSPSAPVQAPVETTASGSRPASEAVGAQSSGGPNTKVSGTASESPNTDGASPAGKSAGLVIQNPAPVPNPADEIRRAEAARREQPAYPPDYSNRPPQGPAYPPPPDGRRPPPPDGRRPPPHFRPPYP
jgi:serine/threonine protein kinase